MVEGQNRRLWKSVHLSVGSNLAAEATDTLSAKAATSASITTLAMLTDVGVDSRRESIVSIEQDLKVKVITSPRCI